MPHHLLAIAVAALLIALPDEAAAQGRGRPKRPQPPVSTGSGPASTAAAPDGPISPSLSTFRQFGSWLADASVAPAGEAWVGIGAGYWRVPGGSQIDVPMANLTYGVSRRVQLAVTVPFYRVSYQGATAHGLDDVYVAGKVAVLDPGASATGVGLALGPVLEILGAGSFDDRRVHWALPVSVERRLGATRLYGSGGYFSRGAVFAGGAVEWTARTGSVVTGALTHSYSTAELAPDLAGGSRQRADVTIGLAHPVTNAMAAWFAAGRSLTSVADGGTSLALSGGLSLRLTSPTSP